MTEPKQAFLTPDFAADIEYKPRIAALEAENKVLRELLHKVVNYKTVTEFSKTENSGVLGWWLANDLNAMCRMMYRTYQAWENGYSMEACMEEINEALVELEFEPDDRDKRLFVDE